MGKYKPQPVRIKYTEDEFYKRDWTKALRLIEQIESYEQTRVSIKIETIDRCKQITNVITKLRHKLKNFSIESRHRQRKILVIRGQINREKIRWLKTLTTEELIEFIQEDNKEYITERSKKPSILRKKNQKDVLKRLEKMKNGERKWES